MELVEQFILNNCNACDVAKALKEAGNGCMKKGLLNLCKDAERKGLIKGGCIGALVSILLIGGVYALVRALRKKAMQNQTVAEDIDTEKEENMNSTFGDNTEYVVTACGVCSNDMDYTPGQRISIINLPEDYVVIEKEGGPCNPYLVSKKMLSEISNYPQRILYGDGES